MKQFIRAATIAAVIELITVGLVLLVLGTPIPKSGIFRNIIVGLHLPSIVLAETITDRDWLVELLAVLGTWLMWFIILLPALLLCNIRKKTPNNGAQAIGDKSPRTDPCRSAREMINDLKVTLIVVASVIIFTAASQLFNVLIKQSHHLPQRKINKVHVGMPSADVRKLLGIPYRTYSSTNGTFQWVYGSEWQWYCFTVYFSAESKVLKFHDAD